MPIAGRIWRMARPEISGAELPYAKAFTVGTFKPEELPDAILKKATPDGRCSGCGRPLPAMRQVPPTVLEWEPGRDLVGDFTVAIGHAVLARRSIAETLAHQICGATVLEIETTSTAGVATERCAGARRVGLTQPAPQLAELRATALVAFDESRSTVVRERCDVCERTADRLDGHERWESTWNPETSLMEYKHHPRVPNGGLVIHGSELGGAEIFKLKKSWGGPANYTLCTDSVKEFIGRSGWTNLTFQEVGEIVGEDPDPAPALKL